MSPFICDTTATKDRIAERQFQNIEIQRHTVYSGGELQKEHRLAC
jgi:hypothetical protein